MKANKIKTISDLKTHEFFLFYRHWKWADMVRNQYSKEKMETGASLFFEPKNGYMFIWYGLLNALLEFMDKTHLCIPSITDEIRYLRKPLRLFRNSIVHILPDNGEPTLIPDTFKKILIDPYSEGRILIIHSEIGKCIQEDFKNRLKKMPDRVHKMWGITEKTPERHLIMHLYSRGFQP